jgi:hypothetical protein
MTSVITDYSVATIFSLSVIYSFPEQLQTHSYSPKHIKEEMYSVHSILITTIAQ